ncbi:DNA glycosylase AlkZ-like family protein [Pseudonocardia humida]|uniref:Winged helix DNA-binding domain-containing protein n=1 Tax=Pseudonocardia humida TaxID=2800819 RepID=A0ABT0ZSN4_9PSEU|nr:crosslink repair DNA glycosylase YcaQ family protein [Pseudonocardia humida]MCO1653737.1 winged helix DNA-binding domain-containing protein [Pseudonocardia humida]
MPAAEKLSRDQVIAHRVAVHGLVERAERLTDLAVLDLGVQDTPPGSLRVALAARLAEPLAPDADVTADGALTIVWTFRGAPHLHRTADLPALAAAGWPRDDADAAARLGWQRARLAKVGMAARAAYREVAGAVAAVLDRPLTKSELSSAVTGRIRPELAPYCQPCGVHHVSEQLLRLAGLAGGLRIRPDTTPLVAEPLPDPPGTPADEGADLARAVATYLRFFSPAGESDAAGFLGTNRRSVHPDWPGDLVAVEVDGRAAHVPADQLDALRAARPAEVVRLLPPSDPLLQGRDREVLVPDPAHRKALWPSLGAPGAVLAGADVAGAWRTRKRGKRLALTVQPFRALRRDERAELAAEARRVAVVRRIAPDDVEVVVEEA